MAVNHGIECIRYLPGLLCFIVNSYDQVTCDLVNRKLTEYRSENARFYILQRLQSGENKDLLYQYFQTKSRVI